MEDRFQKILDISKKRLQKKNQETENTLLDKWMDKYYHRTLWDKIKGWCINKAFNGIFSATKGGLARNLSEMAVKWILTDLEEKDLLQKPELS